MRLMLAFIVVVLAMPGHGELLAALSQHYRGLAGAEYQLQFIDDSSFGVVRSIELGRLPWAPFGFVSPNTNRVWITIPARSHDDWQIAAFHSETGEELGRVSIGWRNPSDSKYQAEFAEESEGGEFLHALTLSGSVWRLSTFSTNDYKPVSDVVLDQGHPVLGVAGRHRLIAHTSHQVSGKDLVRLIDTANSRLIAERTYPGKIDLQFAVTADSTKVALLTSASQLYDIDRSKLKAKRTRRGTIEIIDAASGDSLHVGDIGFNPSSIVLGGPSGHAYLAASRTPAGEGPRLVRIGHEAAPDIFEVESARTCKVSGVAVHESTRTGAIFCNRRVALLGLGDGKLKGWVNAKLVPISGFFSSEGDRLFVREANGSRVALIDVGTSALIARAESGRASVMLAQTLGLNALAFVPFAGIAAPFLFPSWDDTTMVLDEDESHLFVMNGGTGDIAVFEAHTLERAGVEPLGGDTFALFRSSGSQYVFGLGPSQLTAVGVIESVDARYWKRGRFAGINPVTRRAFYGTEHGLSVIDTDTLSTLATIGEAKNVYLVLSSGSRPAQRRE